MKGRGYSEERETQRRGVVWLPIVLYMDTKLEVSSFSHSEDMRAIRDRITDITTGLNTASFTYRNMRRHETNINLSKPWLCLLLLVRNAEGLFFTTQDHAVHMYCEQVHTILTQVLIFSFIKYCQ